MFPQRFQANLPHVERQLPAGGVVGTVNFRTQRSRLFVPAAELAEISLIGIFKRPDEILTGHRRAIMAFDIKLHAFHEAIMAEHTVSMRITSAPFS